MSWRNFRAVERIARSVSIFSRARPSNKSHREQAILAKDLVRQALREAEKEWPQWLRPG